MTKYGCRSYRIFGVAFLAAVIFSLLFIGESEAVLLVVAATLVGFKYKEPM